MEIINDSLIVTQSKSIEKTSESTMETINDSLTVPQRKSFEKFKEYLADVITPDYTDAILIKWLRARNFNAKAAEKIFRENYYNRVLFGVNTILDTYEKPEIAQKYESVGFLGFAKDGSLIRYTNAGRLDFYGFIMSMSTIDLCHYFSYMMECDIKALKEENLKTGRNVNEITYIVDFEGFSLQQVLHKNVIELGLDFTRLVQDCYPEVWNYILIVNAPTIFDKAFHIFKPVLRGTVLDKMKVVNKDSTKDLLLKFIDEDVLPVFLGGKRVDSNGDPKCTEFISFGGKVPEKLYSHNRSSTIMLSPDDPEVVSFILGIRSVRNVNLAVYEGGTVAEIEMRSENGSVGTAVFYKAFGEDSSNPEFPKENEYLDEHDDNCEYKMITVAMRAQAHCTPMKLRAFLPKPGKYVVRFSNASNWFTTRKVLFRYKLIPPSLNSVA